MKGQAATEYVIIVAVILAALIPIFYYTFSESSRTTRINQANDAVNTLSRKAESVYALGPGSRDYVWISIPSGVNSTLVDSQTIRISFSGLGDVVSFPRINVSGTIPTSSGTYRMAVEMLEDIVIIGPVNDTINPNIISTSPTGIVTVNNPILTVTTDEPATCKYDNSDVNYNSMSNTMNGSGISHTKQLNGLTNGPYTYYSRCVDRFGNTMTSSGIITFTVVLDNSAPLVNNTKAYPVDLVVNNYVCINATVSDSGTISNVWASLTTPLNSPLPSQINYQMDDTASCAGIASDGIYGVSIQMQAPGFWYVDTTFANDTANNLGFQNPYPNISINVSSGPSGSPGNAFDYKIPDAAWYFKIPKNIGITARDNQSTLTLATIDLSDEDKNTPPSSERFSYTTVGDVYEGFIIQLNKTKGTYKDYTLRVKTVDAQQLPYNLIVYAYATDSQNIILTNTTNFSMTNIIISGVNRGFNEANITQTVMTGQSQYVKLRVTAQTSMNGKVSHISEADIGVFT